MSGPRTLTKSEVELFRILERSNLLQYFSAFVAQGGDDVSQLHDATEEEFKDILTLVGMSTKPLHILRLRKSLSDWKKNPDPFQQPLPLGTTLPAFTRPSVPPRFKGVGGGGQLNNQRPTQVLPAIQSGQLQSSQSGAATFMLGLPAFGSVTANMPVVSATSAGTLMPVTSSTNNTQSNTAGAGGNRKVVKISEGVPVSQLPNAVLSLRQRQQIELAAEELIKALPEYPSKEPNPRLPVHRAIQTILLMPRDHPDRISEIYKYSAIYGRFNAPRRTGKPMSVHEVSVNEATAQLCLHMPSLLTRREDLFPLGRQVVKMADGTVNKPSAKARKRKAARTQQLAAVSMVTSSAANGQPMQTSVFDTGNYSVATSLIDDKRCNNATPLNRDQAIAELSIVQSKMGTIKYEMNSLIMEHEQLRNAFRNAKQANLGTLMAQIQKQIDAIQANQQLKLEEQASMVVRQRKLMDIIHKREAPDGNPVDQQSVATNAGLTVQTIQTSNKQQQDAVVTYQQQQQHPSEQQQQQQQQQHQNNVYDASNCFKVETMFPCNTPAFPPYIPIHIPQQQQQQQQQQQTVQPACSGSG